MLTILIGLILLAAASDLAWHYPRLPERIATHFNAAGEADGHDNKVHFAVVQGCIMAFIPVLLAGLSWLLPRLPVSMINVPHREYWLAPERRAATQEAVARFLLLMAAVILSFLAGLMHLILQANLTAKPRLGAGVWALTAVQVAFIVAALVGLLWRFRKPR